MKTVLNRMSYDEVKSVISHQTQKIQIRHIFRTSLFSTTTLRSLETLRRYPGHREGGFGLEVVQ